MDTNQSPPEEPPSNPPPSSDPPPNPPPNPPHVNVNASDPNSVARLMDLSDDDDEDDEIDFDDDDDFIMEDSESELEGSQASSVVEAEASPAAAAIIATGTGTVVSTVPNFWDLLPSSIFNNTRRSSGRLGQYSRTLRVFSIAMLPHARPELENGGKVILPPSTLQIITQRDTQLSGPMMFKMTNLATGLYTNCGVLEFIADEGKCFMPFWMMHNIAASEGELISVDSVTIPIATFALFQPQSVDFLDISNPKALLENVLRNFACITKGETIVLHYNNRIYELKILDTKPADAVNIIECDMDVDFAPPVGYVSPSETHQDDSQEMEEDGNNAFVPFNGAGSRIDGKSTEEEQAGRPVRAGIRGQPDFEWTVGRIDFMRNRPKKTQQNKIESEKSFVPFQGVGQTLKSVSNKKPTEE